VAAFFVVPLHRQKEKPHDKSSTKEKKKKRIGFLDSIVVSY
jgi:hypothetical protein